MNKYYFHFCEGEHTVEDRVGMYLPDLEAAKAEATRTVLDVAALTAEGSRFPDCSVRIADASGAVLLTIRLDPAGDISVENSGLV